MLCEKYGNFTTKLNKEEYFEFNSPIKVDDHVLNDDFNSCFCNINENITSKLQYFFRGNLDCGHYCEAVLYVLLLAVSELENIESGIPTRNLLKSILKNLFVNDKKLNLLP